jgi:hypothetical protein
MGIKYNPNMTLDKTLGLDSFKAFFLLKRISDKNRKALEQRIRKEKRLVLSIFTPNQGSSHPTMPKP